MSSRVAVCTLIRLRLEVRQNAASIFPGFKLTVLFEFVVIFVSLLFLGLPEGSPLKRRKTIGYGALVLLSL
jgi:hypothetical protein